MLQPGTLITYVLPASERPNNPGRRWHGRVESNVLNGVYVTSTEPGYEGDREFVPYYCIVAKKEHIHEASKME